MISTKQKEKLKSIRKTALYLLIVELIDERPGQFFPGTQCQIGSAEPQGNNPYSAESSLLESPPYQVLRVSELGYDHHLPFLHTVHPLGRV
ncbi:hypothetical protein AVEN_86634-1 [Araneus ventricosus]|uniref:Uncharacterized protein n=1 Tax=Araneus ventricosus TaxID=182803 RepID=A0A4Y2HUY7_ARAVE|nr:hypothetical protein AVEN_86634-1 [Araneus ventricosus]